MNDPALRLPLALPTVALLSALSLAACHSPPDAPSVPSTDTAGDVGSDAVAPGDAAVEVPPDAPADAGADAPSTADADAEADTATDAGSDAPSATDTEADTSPSALPAACADACAHMGLTVTAAGESYARPIHAGHFGLTVTAGQPTELYVEATEGDDGSCPVEDSPTPVYLVTLSGLTLPLTPAPRTQDDGVKVTLVDFAADLLPDGVIYATAASVTVTPTAASLCAGCEAPITTTDPGAFVALDLQATLADDQGTPVATLAGHVYATHCDSLDATE